MPKRNSLVMRFGQDNVQVSGPVNARIVGSLLPGILLGIAGILFVSFSFRLFEPTLSRLSAHGWWTFVYRPSLLWFSMGMSLLAVRTLLWFSYRPMPPASHEDAPSLTVLIPAFNEGPMVRKSIASCVAADYPPGKLEVIVIDDGSTDTTWAHIEQAAKDYPGLVRAIRFPANRGKRAALAAGFDAATGEIAVTVDSDSIIERSALLAIAGPFRNPGIGAVGGKVAVFNRFQAFLPRMLHVRYVLSFDFLRSVQSTYGAVYCCPGALSAYRLSLIRKILPAWLNQRFLGAACTTGEDRALTNDVLALGYKTVYQGSAVVHTIAPETYGKLCKMYLRWDRSYIREELRLLSSIVWKLPLPALLLTLLEKSITNLRYPVGYLSLALLVTLSISDPWTLVRVLISIGLASLFYTLYFLRSERSWEFFYGVAYAYFSAFTLLWVFPFALLTLRSRSWMTR